MTTVTDLFDRAEAAAKAASWTDAAESFAAGLRLDPDAAPRHYYELGHACEQLEDWKGAADAYSEAVRRRRTAPAWWHFKLGRALRRLKRWADAAEAYEAAIKVRDDVPPGWYFQLGNCYERAAQWSHAQQAYERGLEVDPDVWPLERDLLTKEINEFPLRRTVLRFVAAHLAEIRGVAAESLLVDDRTEVIYSYWAQGFDAAPDIVRRCHRQLKERSGSTVLDLDEPAMERLISLPADIEARGIHPTHRSDLLRLELLGRYGGTWLDATCLVAEDPAPVLRELREPSGYFAFAKRRTTIASWLMTSTPDHYLVRMLRAGLHTYWRHHDRLTHYFVLHHIFEALTELDQQFAELWAATPHRLFTAPFQLRWNFGEPYRDEDFRQMMNGSFVHKLTYKYDSAEASGDTVLAHLLSTI
jgi:tetratricopeptide (TPR) repeat protein